ncbi:TPA: hypothetical protein ACKQ7V_001733 [Streptococcus pyogenes]
MKTRSKHFLNLATLCLALLGTTLLMGQPVKAEVEDGENSQRLVKQSDDDPFGKGKKDGIAVGYKDGKKAGEAGGSSSPQVDAAPDVNPYEQDAVKGQSYKFGYRDGYVIGYYQGLNEVNSRAEKGSTGDSQTEESNDGSEGTQNNKGGSTDNSQTEESNDGSEGTQDQDKPVSDLISIVGGLLAFVLSWFGF